MYRVAGRMEGMSDIIDIPVRKNNQEWTTVKHVFFGLNTLSLYRDVIFVDGKVWNRKLVAKVYAYT